MDFAEFANPAYGQGRFNRRIRLTATEGQVLAELEDCCHAFRSTVSHDGERVTKVEGESLRYPMSPCAGATKPLKDLEGISIHMDAAQINREVDARMNCTHLYDMTVLAIDHIHRGGVRVYDVIVEDEVDKQPADVKVLIDGKEVLHWKTLDWQILEPADIAGNAMHRGFAAWANDHYQGDEKLAAFALQKGYMVSSARRWDLDKFAGQIATDAPHQIGACFSYQPETAKKAIRLGGTMRDFTDAEAKLLTFQ